MQFAGLSTERLVLTPAESLHRAIAARVFGAVGPVGRPARFLHDGVSRLAYGAIRGAAAGLSSATAAGIRLATGDDVRALSRSPRGRAAISAINALAGDVLDERDSALAIPLALRLDAADVAPESRPLRRAYPDATARLAVFLHGLGETDEHWLRGKPGPAPFDRTPFGVRLRRDLGFTPLYVRYNTGLHVSENGNRLSGLLERVVTRWPVPVEEIVLIGHSMGGLVARAACHSASLAGRRWPAKARHLVALGTPHTGVPLEKLVHMAAWVLRALPESRPLADILDLRSAGIRDLRFGYVVEDDWRLEDPGRLLHDRRTDIPGLPWCTHTFISASVTRDARHPLSWIGGDLLVRTESAAGRRMDGTTVVSADSVVQLGALTHFDLLDHPLVYEHIRRALTSARQGRLGALA